MRECVLNCETVRVLCASRMCAWYARTLLVLMVCMLSTGEAAAPIKIRVVSPSPALAQILAAAAEAALEDAGARHNVEVAPVEPNEPLAMPSHVCAQTGEHVSAIVASGEPDELKLAAAAAARAGIPLFLVAPTPLATPPEELAQWEAVHMYPQHDTLIQACAALCNEKGWKKAVLLYDEPLGARLAQGIADAGADTKLLARRLPPLTDLSSLRNILLILKKAEHTKFIVWCDKECCNMVLDVAQKVGLLAERHSYILLALDLHTIDLEPYSHGGANITGLQFFNVTKEEPMLSKWREKYIDRFGGQFREATTEFDSIEKEAQRVVLAPPTSLILTYDVVREAAEALRRLRLKAPPPSDSDACEPKESFIHADTLINYLCSEDWHETKARARRAGLLCIAELLRGGELTEVGQWQWDEKNPLGIRWARPNETAPPLPDGLMDNQTFVVLIALSKPYVMMKESSDRLSGNDRFEGFCIELIDKLSKLLNFNYILLEQVGGDYDTMVRRVNESNGREIHFAITDLTITAEREKLVDFTTPFMNLGISIVYRKPTAPDPKLFAFMLPFSTGVWFCLLLGFVGTSLVLYVVGHLCPDEWQNPYPCIEEPEALENQFTLSNAMWFTLGAILCQGSEIAPVAYGSRAVASAWWIFALVITSSYTANLATLLAKKNNNVDFSNVGELANNTLGITYGAKANGSTYRFFNYSQEGIYNQMFQKMLEWDMPIDNDIGIERVNINKKYAFLMESTTIEYSVERNCNLTQVGGLLDSKGYGIAMAKDSAYRQSLNLALLKLQEAGELRDMKHRWWKEMRGGGACNEAEDYENEELKMKNFMGLFLVLGIGCVVGVLISVADLMIAAWRKPRDPTVPYFSRLKEELRFVFHFQQSVKPVHGPLLPPPTPETESIESEPLEEQEEEREIDSRLRSPSFQSVGVRSRRRSSLHNASVRLTRHTRQGDATSPTRVRKSDASMHPRVRQSDASAHPRVRQSDASMHPRVQQNNASAHPRLRQSDASAHPRVRQSDASAHPRVRQRDA